MLPELYDEQVEIPEQVADVVSARDLMIGIQQIKKEIETVKQTKAAVLASYDARLDTLVERKARAEGHLHDYLINANGGEKLSLPDVGTAFLAKVDAKVAIADKKAAEAKYGAQFRKSTTTFDETRFKEWALKRVTTTGEIPEGCAYVPETQDLRIREA